MGGTENIKNRLLSSAEAIDELIRGNICEYAWNKVYRASVLNGIWFPKGRYFEDSAVMYRIFLNSDRIYTLNEKLYFYLQRSDSIVATMNAKKLSDLYRARRERFDVLRNIYPDIAERAVFKVALSALRLYDRSLWEQDDPEVLADAKSFLIQNQKKILKEFSNMSYKLFFYTPKLYDFMRKGKHQVAKTFGIRK